MTGNDAAPTSLKDISQEDRHALVSVIICVLLVILILYSIYVRVQMYMLGHSLWVDEAKLAENIVDRTMSELLTPPLENRQTAPVLYLVVVKALTMLFGASEAVLRVFSFAALIGMLIVQGVLLRKVFRVSLTFTLFSVAVCATLGHYMYFSNEFKPYMGDALFVLVVILGYYLYREGCLGRGIKSAVMLGLICSVSMLFSTPAVFAAAAVFIVEFVAKCVRKDRSAILLVVIGGAVFIALFALNYFLWLKPIATDEGMIEYWADLKFDFMMINADALAHNFSIIKGLLDPVWPVLWIAVPFAVLGFLLSALKRNIYTAAAGVFFILLLVASAIDKYPIMPRLWTFFYVILFIYAFIFIDSIRTSLTNERGAKAANTIIPLILAFALLAPNLTTFTDYGKGAEYTVWKGSQANPLIEYVRENIRDGESLYSFFSANLILKYRNGYHSYRIGDVQNDNIIFGTTELDDDVEAIAATNGAYILFYHDSELMIDSFINRLRGHGRLELVMDINGAYLYWFSPEKRE